MGKALISTMNELHCTAAEQLHFFHFLARWDRAPSTLPSDGWSINLAPLLVSVQEEHFVVGVKFIEITRWAWAGHHTNDGPRDSPQETGDSRRARQDLWSGQGADTTQAKGIFTFFLPRLRCKLVRTFFAIFEIDLGSSNDDDDNEGDGNGDGDWGLARAIVKRVINEFLKGSLGILENFNWNMLLRKSARNCH